MVSVHIEDGDYLSSLQVLNLTSLPEGNRSVREFRTREKNELLVPGARSWGLLPMWEVYGMSSSFKAEREGA